MHTDIQKDLKKLHNKEKARFFPKFFKSGKGEYAEGDKFIGVTVPQSRVIAKKYKHLPLNEVKILLKSKIHEERLVALLILVDRFKNASSQEKETIFNFYNNNIQHINNWDLVDLSADKIIGGYLIDKKDRSILITMSNSQNMWERRIAIISTFQFIKKKKEYKDTFIISKRLLYDKEDLIHKAVGWVLREVGKRISEKKRRIFKETL